MQFLTFFQKLQFRSLELLFFQNLSAYLVVENENKICKKLFKFFTPNDLGINLNIGHLNLASKAFNFSKEKFVKMVKPYIVAFELSHNNGFEDQHLPLQKGKWYWSIINDPYFVKAYKILEFRNTNIKKITKVINLFN